MKKGQIIKAVLFIALIGGLIPYLPKRAQVPGTQIESAIEVPVENVIDQGEPTQRQSVTGFRTKSIMSPTPTITGNNNTYIGRYVGTGSSLITKQPQ